MERLSGRGRAFLPILVILSANAAAAPIVVVPQDVERAGIATVLLHADQAAPVIPVLGTVLDPGPLLQFAGQLAAVKAQVAGANAKVVLEKQQMAQASALYQGRQVISLAEYQKAAGELAANEAVLTEAQAKQSTLLARLEAEWGPALAAAIRDNADPLPQLAAGKAMLIGLSLPPGKTIAEPPREVAAEASGIRIRLRLIGPVPKMLGGFPGQAFVYQAAAQAGVPIGSTVSASLPAGPARSGVWVPWPAVLWQDNRAVVFRATSGHRFEPVPITTDIAGADGYFVATGLAPGDRVVVRGAALLLGAGKQKPPAGADEDED